MHVNCLYDFVCTFTWLIVCSCLVSDARETLFSHRTQKKNNSNTFFFWNEIKISYALKSGAPYKVACGSWIDVTNLWCLFFHSYKKSYKVTQCNGVRMMFLVIRNGSGRQWKGVGTQTLSNQINLLSFYTRSAIEIIRLMVKLVVTRSRRHRYIQGTRASFMHQMIENCNGLRFDLVRILWRTSIFLTKFFLLSVHLFPSWFIYVSRTLCVSCLRKPWKSLEMNIKNDFNTHYYSFTIDTSSRAGWNHFDEIIVECIIFVKCAFFILNVFVIWFFRCIWLSALFSIGDATLAPIIDQFVRDMQMP